jgi:hypothetical protein
MAITLLIAPTVCFAVSSPVRVLVTVLVAVSISRVSIGSVPGRVKAPSPVGILSAAVEPGAEASLFSHAPAYRAETERWTAISRIIAAAPTAVPISVPPAVPVSIPTPGPTTSATIPPIPVPASITVSIPVSPTTIVSIVGDRGRRHKGSCS